MSGAALDVLALLAQVGVFLAGMIVSLAIGMVIAAHFDSPGGLLVSTIIAGAGLLGAAVGSQALRDHLLRPQE